VPPGDVLKLAYETGAIPYGIPGAELSHEGALCSFDAFLKKYALNDKAAAACSYCRRRRYLALGSNAAIGRAFLRRLKAGKSI
jgi:hypothetical protein